ncbi:MAG: hypothetical protein WCW13_06130 [archaeon]
MGYDFGVLLGKITKEDVLGLKNDLIMLFDSEVIARGQYFQELRKFEGNIFETIKWLYQQEEWHVSAIEQILNKGNVLVKEKPLKPEKFGDDAMKIIKIDIIFEEKTVLQYKSVMEKAGGALKEILTNLMEEELVHVERLKKYVKE